MALIAPGAPCCHGRRDRPEIGLGIGMSEASRDADEFPKGIEIIYGGAEHRAAHGRTVASGEHSASRWREPEPETKGRSQRC